MPGDVSMGDATVAVVELRPGGMQTEMYKSRLELVLAWLDNGQLGASAFRGELAGSAVRAHVASSHGSKAHVAALLEIIAKAGIVLDTIEGRAPRDA